MESWSIWAGHVGRISTLTFLLRLAHVIYTEIQGLLGVGRLVPLGDTDDLCVFFFLTEGKHRPCCWTGRLDSVSSFVLCEKASEWRSCHRGRSLWTDLGAGAGAFIHCLLGLDYYRIHGTVFQIQPWTMDGVLSGMYLFMLQITMVVLGSLFSMSWECTRKDYTAIIKG